MPQDLNTVLSDFNARIRALEGKYSQFGERLLVVNQNMIEEYKKIVKEIKVIEEEMKELRVDVLHMKEALKDFSKESELFAKKNDLKVLEKYINLWDPLKFITEEDVQRILAEEKKGVKHARAKRST